MVFLAQAPLRFKLRLRMPYRFVEAVSVAISGVSIDFGVIGVSPYPQQAFPEKDVCRKLGIPFPHRLCLRGRRRKALWTGLGGALMRTSRILRCDTALSSRFVAQVTTWLGARLRCPLRRSRSTHNVLLNECRPSGAGRQACLRPLGTQVYTRTNKLAIAID